MSLNYTANTDFNGDGNFSECELDASWATLQVKKLLETSGSTTIEIGGTSFNVTNNDTFLEAVKAMVALNVSASIASDGCAVVSSLPVSVVRVAGDVKYDDVVGYWRLNEPGPEYDTDTSEPSRTFPLYNSSKNNTEMIASSVAWDKSSEVVKYGFGLYNWSTLTIADASGILLNNDNDWTFHWKMFVNKFINLEVQKGSFKASFQYSSETNQVYAGNLAFSIENPNQFEGTFIDVFLVKDSNKLGIKIKDQSGDFIDLGSQTVSGDFFDDISADIKIIGQKGCNTSVETPICPSIGGRTGWGASYVSEIYVISKALLSESDFKSTFYTPAEFRFFHTDDETNVASSMTHTDSGKSIQVEGGTLGTNNDLSLNSSQKLLGLATGGTSKLSYDMDFTNDFTLSFWFRSWANNIPGFLSIISNSNASDKLTCDIYGPDLYFGFNNTNKSSTMSQKFEIGHASGVWNHFCLVKSGGRLAVYANGNYVSGSGLEFGFKSGSASLIAGSPHSGMNDCTLQILNDTTEWGLEISDISFIDGGVVRIDPWWDSTKQESDSHIITALKSGVYFS